MKELQCKATLCLQVMTLLEKFFVHSCHLIHNLSQMLPSQDEKVKEIYKSLQLFLLQLPVSQFRDLLSATSDSVFGLIIEAKAKNIQSGMTYLSKSFLTF